MPTTNMYKVQSICTGVAGSPYYAVGYFDVAAGTATQASAAWAAFVFGSAGANPSSATWNTGPSIEVVDPATGAIQSIVSVPLITNYGSNVNPRADRSAQYLIRWRTGIFAGGREIRGRTNLPFVFSGDQTLAGDPTATKTSFFTGLAVTLLAATGAKHVVWSPKNGAWEYSASGSCSPGYGVLRSRRD